MAPKIKPKVASEIINSLTSGTVPSVGVQHIAVGRESEIHAMIQTMEDVKENSSAMKFWIGDFGSGKSFMLHLLKITALNMDFVVTQTDFTPDNRLHASDRKGVALYGALMDSISVKTHQKGGALQMLIEKWILSAMDKVSKEHNISSADIRNEEYIPLIEEEIIQKTKDITEVGGFEFGRVISHYCKGYLCQDDELKSNALRWLKGNYTTKTEARQDLGVRTIIDDQNYYDMLKNFCKLFVSIGYSGLMINLDEAVNLYKISNTKSREKNYEKVLTMYNDCYQGHVENLFINIAGTQKFLEHDRKGLYSYRALKSRLEVNKYAVNGIVDFAQPVQILNPISNEQILVLLRNLKSIFDQKYKSVSDVSDDQIIFFMEQINNKPGADEFLTPRAVIRDFLNVLNTLRQNETLTFEQLVADITISDERPSEDDLLDSLDSIEIL